jgi:malonate-semialdehyde dehydrogenase (acetylating) / methylmalonate-semialdehyde dehydrogenase
MTVKKLKYSVNGEWLDSKSGKYTDCYNSSTGEVIAQTPQCTAAEVESAVAAAQAAFPAWANTPPNKRVQVLLFKLKALLDEYLDELTQLLTTKNGKVWGEAMGDVLKVTEVVEFACGIPHLMLAPALMNCTVGYDTTQ